MRIHEIRPEDVADKEFGAGPGDNQFGVCGYKQTVFAFYDGEGEILNVFIGGGSIFGEICD